MEKPSEVQKSATIGVLLRVPSGKYVVVTATFEMLPANDILPIMYKLEVLMQYMNLSPMPCFFPYLPQEGFRHWNIATEPSMFDPQLLLVWPLLQKLGEM